MDTGSTHTLANPAVLTATFEKIKLSNTIGITNVMNFNSPGIITETVFVDICFLPETFLVENVQIFLVPNLKIDFLIGMDVLGTKRLKLNNSCPIISNLVEMCLVNNLSENHIILCDLSEKQTSRELCEQITVSNLRLDIFFANVNKY